jgi:hypothetical protein
VCLCGEKIFNHRVKGVFFTELREDACGRQLRESCLPTGRKKKKRKRESAKKIKDRKAWGPGPL